MKNDKTSINPDTNPPEDGAGLEPNDGENQKDDGEVLQFGKHKNMIELEDTCYMWVIDKLTKYELIKSKDDPIITDQMKREIHSFLDTQERCLFFVYNDMNSELICRTQLKDIPVTENYNLAFFIKKDIKKKYNENHYVLEELIVNDYIYGNVNKYFLDQMNEKYIPFILNELKWPEGIKKELIANLHKFMINLSQTYFADRKQVVLYIPKENISDSEIKDKELISRLETIMIEWTTQIRDFMFNQETVTNKEDFDVLNEISYWDFRFMNLTNISTQLENSELQRIIDVLEKHRGGTDNLKSFVSLKSLILDERKKAKEILKYLLILQEPCDLIKKTEIKDIHNLLIQIMDRIRFISIYCEYFKAREKISDLIKKVSIQLMHKFIDKIKVYLKSIKEEYSESLHLDLKLIKNCLKYWQKIFDQARERIKLNEPYHIKEIWDFEQKDLQNIFYDLESFEKRCQNLLDICLCQLQFGKNKKNTKLPIFGGTKGFEIYKQLNDIEEKFDDQMKRLFTDDNKVEDIKINKWQEEYRIFSKHIEDLEDMYKNTISSAFKRVKTIEEGVNYIENFYSLAKRQKIKNFMENEIALEVLSMWSKELDKMKIKNDSKNFVRSMRQTIEGGNALWSKFLFLRIEDYKKVISRLSLIFNPKKLKIELEFMKSNKMNEIKQQHLLLEAALKTYLHGENIDLKKEIEYILSINDQKLEERLGSKLINFYNNPNENPFNSLYQCNYPIDLMRLFAINNSLNKLEEYGISSDIVKKINDVEERTRPLKESVINVIREYNNLVLSIKNQNEHDIFSDHFNKLYTDNILRVINRYWNSAGNETYLNKFRKKIEEVSKNIQQFKHNTELIYDLCDQISKKSYFFQEKNNDIYEKHEYIEKQRKHQEEISRQIEGNCDKILTLLKDSYKDLANIQEPKVHIGFKSYLEEISEKYFTDSVEKALMNSITNMHKAILGFKGINPPAFFKVQINMQVIPRHYLEAAYEFNPTEPELAKIINESLHDIIKHAKSAPNILDRFLKQHQILVEKTDKKVLEDKFKRQQINSNVGSNVPKAIDPISIERKKINPTLSPNKKNKNSISQNKKNKDIVSQNQIQDNKQKDINTNKNLVSVFSDKDKDKSEGSVFQKAREVQLHFEKEYKKKGFDKEFAQKLNIWKGSKAINDYLKTLGEEENRKQLNAYFVQFENFLLNEGAEIKDFTLNLTTQLKYPQNFRNDLISIEDNSTIPETIHNHIFIQFDATNTKKKLINMSENILNFILDLIKKKTKEELVDKVELEFNEHEEKFNREPKTKEEYKFLSDELDRCVKEKSMRFTKISAANRVVTEIILQHAKGGDDLMERVNLLEKRKETYDTKLEEAQKILHKVRKKLAEDVSKEYSEFKSNVEDMKKEFLMSIPDKIEGGIKEEMEETNQAFIKLDFYEDKCEAFRIKEKEIDKGLELFQDDLHIIIEGNKDLLDVEELIKSLKRIWEIKREMNNVVKAWRTTQFKELNLDKMAEDKQMIETKLVNNCKDLKTKPIYSHMKDQLDLFQNTFFVLGLLRDDSMNTNPSHWEKLQNRVPEKFDPNAPEFTFEKILDLFLHSFKDLIIEIVDYARAQQKIDFGIKKINQSWKELNLNIEIKFSSDQKPEFAKLTDNARMTESLDTDLAEIAKYKSTKYYDDFKERIDELENELNKISDVFIQLKQVQEKWSELLNVFNKDKDDMAQQAVIEHDSFKANTVSYLNIFDGFSKNKKVKVCFLQDKLDIKLRNLSDSFYNIEKGLNKYLEAKRTTFERLYFLSNHDLLELLGNAFEEKIINFHLSKLFGGIDRVKIEIDQRGKSEKKVKIFNVYDCWNEELKLDDHIELKHVVEIWMKDLETEMKTTMEKMLSSVKSNKEIFNVKTNEDLKITLEKAKLNGQLLLIITQYQWRKKIEQECFDSSKPSDSGYSGIYDTYREVLNTIIKYVNESKEKIPPNDNLERNRLILFNYIVTIKYLMDVTTSLKDHKVRSPDNYDWQKLLKFQFQEKKDNQKKVVKANNKVEEFLLLAEQLNNTSNYGYEYIGNKERIVITPLTEKCYLTMMTAIFYNRGGALQGPAGTGKTETIKDLARNLGKFVIVFNCSSKNNYNTMATIFLGLLRTGAWCCFDEFNRIEVEVLSVVRIQLTKIFDGLRSNSKNINFKGSYVDINKNLAVFITMNPSYIYRSELPDNLKTLFRPISVMMAEKMKICEIKFLSEGYQTSSQLSQKLTSSLEVMEQQLSKQNHYDFSLRAIIAILKHASLLKKKVITTDESVFVKMAITEIIKPKLVEEDEEIFNTIMITIFNQGRIDQVDRHDIKENESDFRKEIKDHIERKGLTGSPYLVTQIIQLFNYFNFKHGIMLVGETLSGKSTCIKLMEGLSDYLSEKKKDGFHKVHITRIYPKSVEIDDLYGKQDPSQEGIFSEGLLPHHLNELCNMRNETDKDKQKWLVLDGPVDSLWIETLNTVLDETKMLSLPSGYRINLKPDVKIVFETENLSQATPATVSRVGLVFFEADKLSWFPIARNWLDKKRHDKLWEECIARWFDKYVYKILDEMKNININSLIVMHENHIILTLINIFESFIDEIKRDGNGDDDGNDEENRYWDFAERLFIFSFVWAIGGCLDEQSRIIVDTLIRKHHSNYPPHSTVFDFIVNPEKEDWGTWEEKMIQFWMPSSNTSYNEIFVPTIDIVKNKTIIQNLIKYNKSPFIIGSGSSGKSTIVKSIFKTIDTVKYKCISINCTYNLSPKFMQEVIESNFEKRNNRLYPPSNKKALCFVDDLNLPKKDSFNNQTTNEMVRQFFELEGWYDTEKLGFTNIKHMLMIASIGISGENKSDVSSRLTSKFVPLTLPSPNDPTKFKIFHTVLSFYLSNFPNEDIKKLSEGLANSMIGLYNSILEKEQYLPTPTKCHYIFSLRDITKIFEQVSKAKESFYTREYFIKLWVHETFRTFYDRFMINEDKNSFRELLSKQLETNLGVNFKEVQLKDNRDCIFVDFMSDKIYDEVNDFDELRKLILQKVSNNKSYSNMVFFDQAINYICILNRIINKNNGCHGLLIGTGASGRTSYLKIACDLSNVKLNSLNSGKEMKLKDWKDYIKLTIKNIGKYNQKSALLFKENDIFSIDVVEDINHLVINGMIPILMNEEFENIKNDPNSTELIGISLEKFIENFNKNCLENIHIFLNISPLGDKLREYCRIYPSLISHSTLVYFADWPQAALLEVAKHFLGNKIKNINSEEANEDLVFDIADILSQIHTSVLSLLPKYEIETKRKSYFTSSNFIELIKTINKYLNLKQNTIINNIAKYKLGLHKISIGKEKIAIMTVSLEEKDKEEVNKRKELEKIMDKINNEKKICTDKEHDLELEREKHEKHRIFFEKHMQESMKELAEAQKPMEEARLIAEKNLGRDKLLEYKNMQTAGPDIVNVFSALMAMFNKSTKWADARSYLQHLTVEKLTKVEELPVTPETLPNIQKYSQTFNFEKLENINVMIPFLAKYIVAVEKYFKAKWNSDVKKRNLDEAKRSLDHASSELQMLENKLNEIKENILKLELDKNAIEENLRLINIETNLVKQKLERANLLIEHFKSEEGRWSEQLEKNQDLLKNVLGNSILAAAILTYFGIFTAQFREELMKVHWINILKSKKIDFSNNFDFLDFVSNPREIQDWVISELPNDRTFKENAVIIKYSLSFPLIIDPQDQAYSWIKTMVSKNEDKNFTKVYKYTPQTNNYLNLVKNNLEAHQTVLINNIGDSLGMDLDEAIKNFNKDKHKLYLMTKLPNPHFMPEVSARTNIINFLVNEKGLEEQLLSLVVKEEKKETEDQIIRAIDSIFKSSKTLDLSEEMILQSLNQAHDNYLDDEKLINDLKRMKDESIKMTDELKQVNFNMEKILTSREEYRLLAKKVSKMYFVLYGMNSISNMYEFSLSSYKSLFTKSIVFSRTSGMSENSDDRIKSIEKLHIEKLLQYSNQSLFERDRIIFSLQLCLAVIISNEEDLRKELELKSKIMRRGNEEDEERDFKNQDFFNMEEFKYLISPVPDTFDTKGMLKPSWITDEECWRYLNYLETKIPDFKGINSTFTHNNGDWYKWFISKDLEIEPLPVEWETKCRGRKNIRRLLFIKALRPDKFSSALKKFINENLDLKDIKETTRSLKEILEQDVNCRIPLLIVHGSGIDPSESIQKLWDTYEEKKEDKKDHKDNLNDKKEDKRDDKSSLSNLKEDKKERRLSITTLNHDQIGNTLNELSELVKVGGWLFIANTHFTLQTIPILEKKLEDLNDVHNDFRLIVSTNPHIKYPISFLQKCEKITFEVPKGITINMARIFDDLIKENPRLEGDREKEKYSVFSKITFSLCIFHSLLIERKKFKSYGWTSLYDFNNSDFKICFDIIRNYMQKFVSITDFPWKAVQELIAINYGSRFTSEVDMQILKVYAKQYFSPKIIQEKNYNFSNSEIPYCLPDDAVYERAKQSLSTDSSIFKSDFSTRMMFYRDEVKRSFPKEDQPEIFGLHFNAEISAEKQENLLIIENIRSLSTEIYNSNANSYENNVFNKVQISMKKLPKLIPIEKSKRTVGFIDKKQPDPLIYVLIQECTRYNNLINLISEDLKNIENALKGNVLLNPLIEKQISQIYEDKIPLPWISNYPSTKPLAMFLNDLNQRVDFFTKWLNLTLSSTTVPYYVLSYFINPHGFISAIKQKYCIRHESGIPFSKVEIEYKVTNEDDEGKIQTKQGFLIKGILIEGGYWDKKVGAIRDENNQDLYCHLPIVIMTAKGVAENDILNMQNQQGQNVGLNPNVNLTHSFPVYYIPIRGDYLGKSTYIMDIKLTLFKDKDRELEENRLDKSHPDYWIKKGTCLLLSKND